MTTKVMIGVGQIVWDHKGGESVSKGREVGIGDSVEFKSDIEQSGRIVAIKRGYNGKAVLVLKPSGDHFYGEYLYGSNSESTTEMPASDCW